ncbi:hypothetical protein A4U49_07680 [Acidithiobacillus ferrivorans]|nr:hypothetical protein A4U49_07680 [Acidithiobacillus ferrivorans]
MVSSAAIYAILLARSTFLPSQACHIGPTKTRLQGKLGHGGEMRRQSGDPAYACVLLTLLGNGGYPFHLMGEETLYIAGKGA